MSIVKHLFLLLTGITTLVVSLAIVYVLPAAIVVLGITTLCLKQYVIGFVSLPIGIVAVKFITIDSVRERGG